MKGKPKLSLEYWDPTRGKIKKKRARVIEWGESSVTCIWRKKVASRDYDLYMKEKKLDPTSPGIFSIMDPVIGEGVPAVGSVGDLITIIGQYFSTKKPAVYLQDPVTQKRKRCKVTTCAMELATGASVLEFVAPKLDAGAYALVFKNKIGKRA